MRVNATMIDGPDDVQNSKFRIFSTFSKSFIHSCHKMFRKLDKNLQRNGCQSMPKSTARQQPVKFQDYWLEMPYFIQPYSSSNFQKKLVQLFPNSAPAHAKAVTDILLMHLQFKFSNEIQPKCHYNYR